MSTPTIRCYTLSQTPLLPSPLVLLLFLFLSSLSLTSCAYLRVHSSVELWTSRLEAQPSLLLKPAHRLAHTPNSLSLDPSTRYQRILGFGGAFTEAAAVTFNRLSPTLQADVIRAYFDADKGLGYTLGRVPINSCDFSVASYSFDDVQDDFDLERFDHAVKHDNDTLIPLILKALKASTPLSPPSSSSSSSSPSSSSSSHPSPALKLFASPWSPPAWMKGNGAMLSSSSPCLKPDRRYHDAWALYYVKWLQAYAAHHIPFFGLTVQNEPEFAAPWEACTWTAEEEVAFVVDHLAPTLKRHGLEDVRIMVYDHNKDHVEKWAKVVYGEKRAADAVWGLAVHWYSGDAFDLLEAAHELSPSHALLASEACNCPGVKLNDWSRAEKYAHDIIGDLNHHVVGWTDWNLVLDERGGPNHLGNLCDAPVLVRTDFNPPSVHFQPVYYVLGHFSRFLRPGAIRIAHRLSSTKHTQPIPHIGDDSKDAGAASLSAPQSANVASGNNNLEVTTFVDEERGEVVMVVFNPSEVEEELTITTKGGEMGAVLTVPAHSLHTVIGDSELF